MKNTAQEVFGARAAWYTTSEAHTDKVVLERVVALAQSRPDALALDVATGTGHTAFALAAHARQVIAADVTLPMLAEARALMAAHAVANVMLCQAEAAHLPFANDTFEIITCRRAAHHFPDIAAALDEMRRVLKVGGRLVIDDRSVPEDDFVDATMNQLDVLHDGSHVREYRPSEWERLLHQAGFEIGVIEPYTKHRPLSALTANVEPENVRRIQAIITALTAAQREALHVAHKDGETYTNHWFVMAAATKR